MRKTSWALLFIIFGVCLSAAAQTALKTGSGARVEKKWDAFQGIGREKYPGLELMSGPAKEAAGRAGNQKIPEGSAAAGAYHRLAYVRSVKGPGPTRCGLFAKDYINYIFPSHNFW